MPPNIDVYLPTGEQTTLRPTIGYFATGFTPGAAHYSISRYPESGFTPGQQGSGNSADIIVGDVYNYPQAGSWWGFAGGHTVQSDLPTRQLVVIVQVLNLDGSGPLFYYGVSDVFYFGDVLYPPTGLEPLDGATIDTNLPTLRAVVVPSDNGGLQRVEWQLATDAGFTTNLRTVTEPVADHRASGATSEVVPAASALVGETTWYVRARAKLDDDSDVSAWTSANDFLVQHRPSSTGHAPTGGAARAYNGGELVATWHFGSTSPDLDDAGQYAYQVVVEELDGTPIDDTGKVIASDGQATITGISALLKGETLRWKVRVWDAEDVVGSYSDWQLFMLLDGPTVSLTAPTGTVTDPAVLFTWTTTPGTAGDATGHRVDIYTDDPAVPVYDSGWLAGDPETFTVPNTAGLENLTDYVARVRVRDVNAFEASDTSTFDTSWTPPDAPDVTVEASVFDTLGPVTVLIDALPAYDAQFLGWRLYWRLASDPDTVEQVGSDVFRVNDWVRLSHYRARPNLEQEYAVVQLADRAGTVIESARVWHAITPAARAFWLIGDEETSIGGDTALDVPPADLAAVSSLRFTEVEGDPHARILERAEVPIIGRGIKVETGTDYGIAGTLTVHLLDNETESAYVQQLRWEATLAATSFLRKPSGRVATVNTHDVGYEPQGRDDWIIVSVPYTEAAT